MHSTVHADGSLGQSELHMASGRVQLDRIVALQASIASGEVAIGHIAGPATVDGASFTMRIGEVDGSVAITNAGGQAWIGHASTDVELGSATGDIDIDRADGGVTATSASGAIRIGRMTNGRARLTNGYGNIEVGIAGSAAASIDAHSERGAVHDFVSSQGNSDSSDLKVMIHARTRRGDISDSTRVRRALDMSISVLGGSAALPCRVYDAELWFAAKPSDVELAKALCVGCPMRARCLEGATERGEPWGVWGGQLFSHGVVIPRKRPPGRPRKNEVAA